MTIPTDDTAKSKIARMNYSNFEDAITEKHGIVLENWPLPKFCSPSDIKSRNEVKVLLRAWESGTTRFRLMSDAEWEKWSERRELEGTEESSTAIVDPAAIPDSDAPPHSSEPPSNDVPATSSDSPAVSQAPTAFASADASTTSIAGPCASINSADGN